VERVHSIQIIRANILVLVLLVSMVTTVSMRLMSVLRVPVRMVERVHSIQIIRANILVLVDITFLANSAKFPISVLQYRDPLVCTMAHVPLL
jgi:hypothetical protein